MPYNTKVEFQSRDLDFETRDLEFKSRDLEFQSQYLELKSRDLEFKDYYGMALIEFRRKEPYRSPLSRHHSPQTQGGGVVQRF